MQTTFRLGRRMSAALLSIGLLACWPASAVVVHYVGPNPEIASMILGDALVGPPPPGPIRQIWLFSSASAATITDPLRPPSLDIFGHASLAGAVAQLSSLDPFGTTMPFAGLTYVAGADGFDVNDLLEAVFALPTGLLPPHTPITLQTVLADINGNLYQSSRVVTDVTLPIPQGLNDPLDQQRYIWQNAQIPEPSMPALVLLALFVCAGASALRHQRFSIGPQEVPV